ncbi:MAG TPA: hypothetical protein VGM94_02045 [Galbitalea sp.]|jgi:hypothetical protein
MNEPSSGRPGALRFISQPEAYIPILLDMQGELGALASLDEASWKHTLPHLQIRPRDLRHEQGANVSAEAVIDKISHQLRSHALYLDPAGLRRRSAGEGADLRFVEELLENADGLLNFRPVYLLGQTELRAAVLGSARRHGAMIRVHLDRMQELDLAPNGAVERELEPFRREGIELEVILDLGFLDPSSAVSAAFVTKIVREFHSCKWFSSITLAATSVPVTISKYVTELTIHGLRRRELDLYRALAAAMPDVRFADYGVQNCLAPDPVHASHMVASARLTLREFTFYSRGKGALLDLPRAEKVQQYRDIATRLFEHPWFEGKERCCVADGIIEDCAGGAIEILNQNRWRYVGTRHHIPVVLADLAAIRRGRTVVARPPKSRQLPRGVEVEVGPYPR